MDINRMSEMLKFVKQAFNTDVMEVNRFLESFDYEELTVVYEFFIAFGSNAKSMKIFNEIVGQTNWTRTLNKITQEELSKKTRKTETNTVVIEPTEPVEPTKETEENLPVETINEPVEVLDETPSEEEIIDEPVIEETAELPADEIVETEVEEEKEEIEEEK